MFWKTYASVVLCGLALSAAVPAIPISYQLAVASLLNAPEPQFSQEDLNELAALRSNLAAAAQAFANAHPEVLGALKNAPQGLAAVAQKVQALYEQASPEVQEQYQQFLNVFYQASRKAILIGLKSVAQRGAASSAPDAHVVSKREAAPENDDLIQKLDAALPALKAVADSIAVRVQYLISSGVLSLQSVRAALYQLYLGGAQVYEHYASGGGNQSASGNAQ